MINTLGYCAMEYAAASEEKCITLASFFNTSEVEIPSLGLTMKHYALALVIDKFGKFNNPVFSEGATFRHVLDNLDAHLEELTRINVQTYPMFHDIISTVILSNYAQLFSASENSSLPNIIDFLAQNEFNLDCEPKSIEHAEKIANVALASFILLVATQQETQPMERIISRLMKEVKFQVTTVTYLYQHLQQLYKALYNSGRTEEAIGPLISCCEAAWSRVYLFSGMLQSSEDGVSREFSSKDDSIVHLVKNASEHSAELLLLLKSYKRANVNSTLVTCVNRWIASQSNFHIPSPVALIKAWVQIQCQENVHAQTCYSLVPSLGEPNHKQQSGIILEQELFEYRKRMENGNGNQELCKQMEISIKGTINELKTGEESLRTSQSLLISGIKLASWGHQGEVDCIEYIKEGINLLLMKRENGKDLRRDEICFIIKGFLLSALFQRTAFPLNKDFTKSIEHALRYWPETEKFKLSEIDCKLIFYVADLLAFEGCMELQSKLYNLLIGCLPNSERRLEDFLDIVLQSGNMCHSLCSSPVDDAFINMFLKHSSSSSSVSFWKSCTALKKSGNEQIFSVFPTLNSTYSTNDDHATKAQETIRQLKDVASRLITKGTDSDNAYTEARYHYNLSERLLANGLYIEALCYAKEAYQLRDKLLTEQFIIEWDENDKIKKFAYKILHTLPFCTLSVESHGLATNEYVPTSWNIVRCYLESTLQKGLLTELIGNRDEAIEILSRGSRIAEFLNLPLFFVSFSTAIGNTLYKIRSWDLAFQQLKLSQNSLDGCKQMGCKKCNIVMEAQLNQKLGDLSLSYGKKGAMDVSARKDSLKAAKDCFETAKSKLEEDEWRNPLSKPRKEISDEQTNPVICHCEIDCEPDDNCWHCLPAIIENSSLKDLTYLKWECVKRRHLLQIHRKQAKCAYELEGGMAEELRLLRSSIQVLVARSTFHKHDVSISFIESLLKEEVMSEAFGVEHASILYDLCCFSLKYKDSRAGLSEEGILLGLKMAFILSREVRTLHEKVSRLLAVLCSKKEGENLRSSSTRPTMTQWSTYFHQSSIGTFFDTCFLSQDQIHKEAVYSSFRDMLMPDSVQKLEKSVLNFFKGLPNVPIVCVSLLTDSKLFKHILPPNSNSVWIMLSRMKVNSGPVVVILPCETVTVTDSNFKETCKDNSWSPWAETVIDDLVPGLRNIKVEDHNRVTKKEKRDELETIFQRLLRNLEDSWLDKCKDMLVGEWSKYDSHRRNPVIIVPDLNVQMIPWENLPILHNEEVYRMLSVGAILCSTHKRARKDKTEFDPHKCFYLLDDSLNKDSYKGWGGIFENIKGKTVGNICLDEIKHALTSQDVFLYDGHDDGRQYISSEEIRKTKTCLVLLMGCRSGYISSSRSRVPDGAPLDYLLAGSPAVVANLWTVLSSNQDAIIKTLFESWTKVKLSRNVATNKKRKRDDYEAINLGSSISKARGGCPLRYLDGSASVIFGVPMDE